MTSNAQEQLSALLDGELPKEEVELVVRRLARDPSLRATMTRYGLIGAALRDELPPGRPADVLERVRASLEGATVQGPGRPSRPGRALRMAGGFAVAASVALVALVALPGRSPEAPPPVLTATEIASPSPEQRLLIQPVYTRAAGGGPDQLTRYYVNHSQYAPPMGGRALTRIIIIHPEATASEQREPEAAGESPREDGSAQ